MLAAVTKARSAAEEAFTVAAWQVAANQVTSEDMQRLRKIQQTAQHIDQIVSPPLSSINAILGVFQEMRNTGLFGVTAWDLAIQAHPQLSQYEESLRHVRAELQEWNAAAEQVVQNVGPAVTSLDQAKQGQDVNYAEVASQLERASQGLDRLQTKSVEVQSTLARSSDGAGEAAQSLRESQVPSQFVQPMSQLSGVRSTAQQEKQQFMQEWQSHRSSLLNEWRVRKSAETRVYGTLGGLGTGLLGIVLFGWRSLAG